MFPRLSEILKEKKAYNNYGIALKEASVQLFWKD